MSRPLRVLMYHRILDPSSASACNPSLISASPAAFDEQMRYVATRYRVMAMDEVLDVLGRRGSLPRRALLVTFDDGYRDFGEVAWPILRKYALPATVFVPTGYPGVAREFWWDRLYRAVRTTRCTCLRDTPLGALPLEREEQRRSAVRRLQRLIKATPHGDAMALVDRVCRDLGDQTQQNAPIHTWEELRSLAADGVTLAPHTHNHPALTQVSTRDAHEEVRMSREVLRREVGQVPPVFAYPFGDHDERCVGVIREEGFKLALTCDDGHTRLPGEDAYRLRRTGITPRTGRVFFRARLTSGGAFIDAWRHRGLGGAATRPAESGSATSVSPQSRRGGLKLAYIMSRFPKLSETFVLNEIEAMDDAGTAVEVYPLRRERQAAVHPEAARWMKRARFHPFISSAIVRSNARFLAEHPLTYFRVMQEAFGKTWGSRKFFVGALGLFPKAVHFAYEMRERGVTHIHAHFATHPALAALIVHRLTGIPFSFTAHGSDLHVDRRMLDRKVEAAAFAVTVSNFNREVIIAECGEQARSKVHVIHCGVDPEFFTPGAGHPDHEGPFRIICVASLEEVKGHKFLIAACRILRERGVGFECRLLGDGPLRSDLEERIREAGLSRQIHLLGGQPRPVVVRMLSEAHAAVLASHPTADGRREGIPVALMEAMAAGVPVVATAISGIPELGRAEETGLLVPSGDPVALALALERLHREPALAARLARGAREHVVSDFNLRKSALALLDLVAAGVAPPTLEPAPSRAPRWGGAHA